MKTVSFYLDFVSPYAWLAFHQLPRALQGLSYQVNYRPVLLGALLQQHQNPGPAGIVPKRAWTYRHAVWLGHASGAGLQMPAHHPFSPLPLLRMALRCSDDGCINRFVADRIFRHVWHGGQDALAPARLEALQTELRAQHRGQDPEVQAKQLLRNNTEMAQAQGIFGVPSMVVDGRVFWGQDSLPMLRAYLEGDAWFEGDEWEQLAVLPSGLKS